MRFLYDLSQLYAMLRPRASAATYSTHMMLHIDDQVAAAAAAAADSA